MYIFYLYVFHYSTIKFANEEIYPHAPPVFVLGHPRTGTTLLHSLLALDTERFAICDTFMVGFPHCFLCFECIGKFLFKGILSKHRPMDNMRLHFDLPQEDELGTNLLSGLRVSPYCSLVFMKDEMEYRKYQCLKEGEVSDKELGSWVQSFQKLIWKIKVRDTLKQKDRKMPRQLVLKSPCHTGRVRLLLKLYPGAKFVFVHRNPYEVFLSGAHMASTTYGWMFLQSPSDEDLQEYILNQGEILHNEYFDCRNNPQLLNDKNSAEVSFAELTKDPVKSMQEIYKKLGFDSFDPQVQSSYPMNLSRECEELKGYQRNKFNYVILNDDLKASITNEWKKQFDVLGYSDLYPPDQLQ